MLETRILPAAVAAVALLAPVNVLLAQYNGPPIIIQTPQFPQPSMTNNLKPLTGTTLPGSSADGGRGPRCGGRARGSSAGPALRCQYEVLINFTVAAAPTQLST